MYQKLVTGRNTQTTNPQYRKHYSQVRDQASDRVEEGQQAAEGAFEELENDSGNSMHSAPRSWQLQG